MEVLSPYPNKILNWNVDINKHELLRLAPRYGSCVLFLEEKYGFPTICFASLCSGYILVLRLRSTTTTTTRDSTPEIKGASIYVFPKYKGFALYFPDKTQLRVRCASPLNLMTFSKAIHFILATPVLKLSSIEPQTYVSRGRFGEVYFSHVEGLKEQNVIAIKKIPRPANTATAIDKLAANRPFKSAQI